MKKNLLTWVFACMAASVSAQFEITGVPVDTTARQTHLDTVFVVDGTTGGVLTFRDGNMHKGLRWLGYDLDGNTNELASDADATSLSVSLLAQASVGYKLEVDDDTLQYNKWVWVFDYQAYPLQLNGITADSDVSDRCHYIQLLFDYEADKFLYDSIGGGHAPFELERYFVLTYDSTYYSDGSYLTETVSHTLPAVSYYPIESPLDNTVYSLKGDCFAESFGRATTVETDEFQAIAVAIQPEASVRERDAKNELDRDVSSNLNISG